MKQLFACCFNPWKQQREKNAAQRQDDTEKVLPGDQRVRAQQKYRNYSGIQTGEPGRTRATCKCESANLQTAAQREQAEANPLLMLDATTLHPVWSSCQLPAILQQGAGQQEKYNFLETLIGPDLNIEQVYSDLDTKGLWCTHVGNNELANTIMKLHTQQQLQYDVDITLVNGTSRNEQSLLHKVSDQSPEPRVSGALEEKPAEHSVRHQNKSSLVAQVSQASETLQYNAQHSSIISSEHMVEPRRPEAQLMGDIDQVPSHVQARETIAYQQQDSPLSPHVISVPESCNGATVQPPQLAPTNSKDGNMSRLNVLITACPNIMSSQENITEQHNSITLSVPSNSSRTIGGVASNGQLSNHAALQLQDLPSPMGSPQLHPHSSSLLTPHDHPRPHRSSSHLGRSNTVKTLGTATKTSTMLHNLGLDSVLANSLAGVDSPCYAFGRSGNNSGTLFAWRPQGSRDASMDERAQPADVISIQRSARSVTEAMSVQRSAKSVNDARRSIMSSNSRPLRPAMHSSESGSVKAAPQGQGSRLGGNLDRAKPSSGSSAYSMRSAFSTAGCSFELHPPAASDRNVSSFCSMDGRQQLVTESGPSMSRPSGIRPFHTANSKALTNSPMHAQNGSPNSRRTSKASDLQQHASDSDHTSSSAIIVPADASKAVSEAVTAASSQYNMQQEVLEGDQHRVVRVEVRRVKKNNLPRGVSPMLIVSMSDVTEKARAESLLLQLVEQQLGMASQMWPMHVIEYLSLREQQNVQPELVARHHTNVTIMFLDVVGFTAMSKEVTSEEVMRFMNEMFSQFDEVVTYYQLQKVETAGDCYIVAAGVLIETDGGFRKVDEAPDPAEAARTLMDCAKDMLALVSTIRMPHNQNPAQVRIGIHTGDCTSGLIGSKLPKWSLYGDSINTASRMESTSLPGRIQVSEETHKLLPDEEWIPTGGVQIKGKGKMMTYLWEPSRKGLSTQPSEGNGEVSDTPDLYGQFGRSLEPIHESCDGTSMIGTVTGRSSVRSQSLESLPAAALVSAGDAQPVMGASGRLPSFVRLTSIDMSSVNRSKARRSSSNYDGSTQNVSPAPSIDILATTATLALEKSSMNRRSQPLSCLSGTRSTDHSIDSRHAGTHSEKLCKIRSSVELPLAKASSFKGWRDISSATHGRSEDGEGSHAQHSVGPSRSARRVSSIEANSSGKLADLLSGPEPTDRRLSSPRKSIEILLRNNVAHPGFWSNPLWCEDGPSDHTLQSKPSQARSVKAIREKARALVRNVSYKNLMARTGSTASALMDSDQRSSSLPSHPSQALRASDNYSDNGRHLSGAAGSNSLSNKSSLKLLTSESVEDRKSRDSRLSKTSSQASRSSNLLFGKAHENEQRSYAAVPDSLTDGAISATEPLSDDMHSTPPAPSLPRTKPRAPRVVRIAEAANEFGSASTFTSLRRSSLVSVSPRSMTAAASDAFSLTALLNAAAWTANSSPRQATPDIAKSFGRSESRRLSACTPTDEPASQPARHKGSVRRNKTVSRLVG